MVQMQSGSKCQVVSSVSLTFTMDLYSCTIVTLCVCLKGLKAASESALPDLEKKDTLLGLYWAAQMASSHASSACSAR